MPSDWSSTRALETTTGLEILPPPTFSYASDEVSRISQKIIRGVEKVTGQPRIRRMYEAYTRLGRPPELFWEDAIAALKLQVEIVRGSIQALAPAGPQIVIANHPYGVIDGIIICHLVSQVRTDYKVMTHSILYQAPEVRRHIIPIDFSGSEEALAHNLRSRREAHRILAEGGVVIVFPAGGVATARTLAGPALDKPWGTFTAQLALRSSADVLPVHFSGQNSRLYQLASQINLTFKLSLLFHEVRNKIGRRFPVAIGQPVPNSLIQAIGDLRAITDYLHAATFRLKPAA